MPISSLFRAFAVGSLILLAAACGSSPDLTDDSSDGGEDSLVVGDVGHVDSSADASKDTSTSDAPKDTTVPIDTSPPPDTDVSTDTSVPPDTTPPPDTAPPPPDGPVDCTGTPLSVDPSNTIDPLTDGPLGVGTETVVVPTLSPLTDVNVKIWYPTNPDGTPHAGKHAWVMFHHAVHGPYPGVIYTNYNTLFNRWASHGFIVFSIDGARIFWPTIAGSSLTWTQQETVAGLMDQAITYFLGKQKDPTWDLSCRLDPDRLAVSGHSRGGGAALLVPTTRTDGAKIKGYVGFQPVDPEALGGEVYSEIYQFAGPALWLDAALDGDVVYPIVAMQYPRSFDRSTHVTILGSKHTYTLDDGAGLATPDQGGATATITPDEHKAVCNQYAVAFLRMYVRDATPGAADFDRIFGPGGMSTTASSGNITTRWKLPTGDPTYLAMFDEPTGSGPGDTTLGDAITTTGAMTATSYETYTTSVGTTGEAAVAKLIHSVDLKWDGTGGALVIPVRSGALSGKTAILFETANPLSTSVSSGTSPLSIEIDDSLGGSATITVDSTTGPGWKLRPRRLSIGYAALSSFTGVSLDHATQIKFVAPATGVAGESLLDIVRVQ